MMLVAFIVGGIVIFLLAAVMVVSLCAVVSLVAQAVEEDPPSLDQAVDAIIFDWPGCELAPVIQFPSRQRDGRVRGLTSPRIVGDADRVVTPIGHRSAIPLGRPVHPTRGGQA